jgi:hypothetical protein
MKTSAKPISPIENEAHANVVPAVRPDATVEELDEWIVALGGRELTPAQAKKLRAQVRWHRIPGE